MRLCLSAALKWLGRTQSPARPCCLSPASLWTRLARPTAASSSLSQRTIKITPGSKFYIFFLAPARARQRELKCHLRCHRYLWDCVNARLGATLSDRKPGPIGGPIRVDDWAQFAVCWLNSLPPRLAVTEWDVKAGDRVSIRDATGTILAASPADSFTVRDETRAFVPSPDSALLAGVVHKELLVFCAADCSVLMREPVSSQLRQQEVLFDTSVFWSPCSRYVAVASTVCDSWLRVRVFVSWLIDVQAKSVLRVSEADTPARFSTCGPWTQRGLLFTQHPADGSASGHTLHLLDCADMTYQPVLGASALITVVRRTDYVLEQVRRPGFHTAHCAVSPDGAWLAGVGGIGLCAWNMQFVRLAQARVAAVWSAPFGPVQEPAESAASLAITWSMNGRRLAVSTDSESPVYCGTHLLALDT